MNLETWIGGHILFALVIIIPAIRFRDRARNRRFDWMPAILVALLAIDCLIGVFVPNYRNF